MCLHSHAYFLQVPCRVLNQLSVYGIIRIDFMERLRPFYTWGMCLMEQSYVAPPESLITIKLGDNTADCCRKERR